MILAAFSLSFIMFPLIDAYPEEVNIVKFEAAKEKFRNGLVYFDKMKYLAAVEQFRGAVADYPEYFTAREYLARSYRLAGYTDEALTEWELLFKQSENPSIKNKIDNINFSRVSLEPLDTEELLLKDTIKSTSLDRYQFSYPVDLTIDADKNIYISSFSTGKIIKLDSEKKGVNSKQFYRNSKLYGLDYNKELNTIVASDFARDSVLLLDTKLDVKKEFGSSGSGEGQFHGPEGVAFTPDGYIYVVDTGNNRVQKFTPDGKFVVKFGEKGEYESMFNNPSDVIYFKGNVYVTDTDNRRLCVYDDYGNFIKVIKSDYFKSPRGISSYKNKIYISDAESGIVIYDIENGVFTNFHSWDKNESFSRAYSSAFDRDGYFYVLDHNYQSVYCFSPLVKQYTNLDIEIVSIDTAKYPTVAFHLNVRTRGGESVYGLKPSNFKVTEDKARINGLYVDYYKEKKKSLSLVLCVDKSDRMKKDKPKDVEWASDYILKKMTKNDRIKVLNFNSDYWTASDFDWSRLRTLKAVSENSYADGSAIGKVLYNAISDLVMKENRRAVILMTDGSINDKSFAQYSADSVINFAKAHYIPIYIFCFSEKSIVLTDIGTKTGGGTYMASDVEALKSIYDRSISSEEYRYAVVYSSFKTPSFKGFWSDVTIEVDSVGQKGIEWGGYFVP